MRLRQDAGEQLPQPRRGLHRVRNAFENAPHGLLGRGRSVQELRQHRLSRIELLLEQQQEGTHLAKRAMLRRLTQQEQHARSARRVGCRVRKLFGRPFVFVDEHVATAQDDADLWHASRAVELFLAQAADRFGRARIGVQHAVEALGSFQRARHRRVRDRLRHQQTRRTAFLLRSVLVQSLELGLQLVEQLFLIARIEILHHAARLLEVRFGEAGVVEKLGDLELATLLELFACQLQRVRTFGGAALDRRAQNRDALDGAPRLKANGGCGASIRILTGLASPSVLQTLERFVVVPFASVLLDLFQNLVDRRHVLDPPGRLEGPARVCERRTGSAAPSPTVARQRPERGAEPGGPSSTGLPRLVAPARAPLSRLWRRDELR